MKKIQLIEDVASPNCYLMRKAIAIEFPASSGVVFEALPCLLGGIFKATNNSAPMIAFANIKEKLAYDRLEMMRFIDKYQLSSWQMNPSFPINTLQIMRGAVVAQSMSIYDRYIDVMNAGMWEQGLNLNDADVFHQLMLDNDLPAADILAASATPEIKSQLIANTQQAVARGAFGIPTVFVGDEMFFGKERLPQIKAMLELNKV